jgi:hypothetical protein
VGKAVNTKLVTVTVENVALQRRLKTSKLWLENLTQAVRIDAKITIKQILGAY